jgi:hypothetical protein
MSLARTGSTLSAPSASGSITIAAPPALVYDLITDLTSYSEIAEETTAIRWHAGSHAAPGAVFKGTNRNGWRRWTTTCTVTDAEPGRRFAFTVRHTVLPIARWRYEIEPTAAGCRVTESMWDDRPGWFRAPAQFATGVGDRISKSSANIAATLERLKRRAEATAGA